MITYHDPIVGCALQAGTNLCVGEGIFAHLADLCCCSHARHAFLKLTASATSLRRVRAHMATPPTSSSREAPAVVHTTQTPTQTPLMDNSQATPVVVAAAMAHLLPTSSSRSSSMGEEDSSMGEAGSSMEAMPKADHLSSNRISKTSSNRTAINSMGHHSSNSSSMGRHSSNNSRNSMHSSKIKTRTSKIRTETAHQHTIRISSSKGPQGTTSHFSEGRGVCYSEKCKELQGLLNSPVEVQLQVQTSTLSRQLKAPRCCDAPVLWFSRCQHLESDRRRSLHDIVVVPEWRESRGRESDLRHALLPVNFSSFRGWSYFMGQESGCFSLLWSSPFHTLDMLMLLVTLPPVSCNNVLLRNVTSASHRSLFPDSQHSVKIYSTEAVIDSFSEINTSTDVQLVNTQGTTFTHSIIWPLLVNFHLATLAHVCVSNVFAIAQLVASCWVHASACSCPVCHPRVRAWKKHIYKRHAP